MANEILMRPIAHIHNARTGLDDDNWGGMVSEITLDSSLPEEGLLGLEAFSHAEILYYFDRVGDATDIPMLRHPRGNPSWPKVGIFAQRNKDRPNHIGLTIVRIVRREGRSLFVEGLDAIDGTPVLDIKPVMEEFLPRGEVRQPQWSHELMQAYWSENNANKS
jgi:tRNA-Thr(GGU) m(6)t(6)A37 methyltransferase TsaA